MTELLPLFNPLATTIATAISIGYLLIILTSEKLYNWFTTNTDRDGAGVVFLYAITTGVILLYAAYYSTTYLFTLNTFMANMMFGIIIFTTLAFLGFISYHAIKDIRAALTTLTTN